MAEPVSTAVAGGALGLKYSTLLGGFIGSLVSLSFVSGLGTFGRVTAVFTGTMTAAYLTPMVVSYWAISPAAENGLGFLLGLTSMNLIPAFLGASQWLRRNTKELLSKRFGLEDGGREDKS